MAHSRQCFVCKESIFECMGSVHAGDFVDAIQGLITRYEIRELCPKCATFYVNSPPEMYYQVRDKNI